MRRADMWFLVCIKWSRLDFSPSFFLLSKAKGSCCVPGAGHGECFKKDYLHTKEDLWSCNVLLKYEEGVVIQSLSFFNITFIQCSVFFSPQSVVFWFFSSSGRTFIRALLVCSWNQTILSLIKDQIFAYMEMRPHHCSFLGSVFDWTPVP